MALQATGGLNLRVNYEQWVQKYGEDQAKYLVAEMSRWSEAYTHGTLINFDFLKNLKLAEQVQQVCAENGWEYSEIPGDLALFEKLVAGEWAEAEFLTVRPGQKVVATFDDRITGTA